MRVRIRYPEGLAIDQDRVANAVRSAMAGGEDPEKIWRINRVPALAQLEEAVYLEGSQDLADAYTDLSAALALPHDQPTRQVLDRVQKAIRRRGVKAEEGQLGLGFEQEHPRLEEGKELEGYKPGQFIPKERHPLDDRADTWEQAMAIRQQNSELSDQFQVLAGLKRSGEIDNKEFDRRLEAIGEQKNALVKQAEALENEAVEGLETPEAIEELTQHIADRLADRMDAIAERSARGYSSAEEEKADADLMQALDLAATRLHVRMEHKKKDLVERKKAELFRSKPWKALPILEGTSVAELRQKAVFLRQPGKHEDEEGAAELEARADAYEEAARLYHENMPHTGRGVDLRGAEMDDPDMQKAPKARWQHGKPCSQRLLENTGLPEGYLKFAPGELETQRTYHHMGQNYQYFGPLPASGKSALFEEARRMRRRIERAFPQWMQQRVDQAGVRVRFTVGPPLRTEVTGTQSAYYGHCRGLHDGGQADRPQDRLCGYWRANNKLVCAQIGHSAPDPGSNSGCVNMEIHEYAHAVDYTLAPDGFVRISDSPEFMAIHQDLEPYLKEYYKGPAKGPRELFAESMGQALATPQVLEHWLTDAPPQWRRLGRFLQSVLREPGTEGAFLAKGVRLYLKLSKAQPDHGNMQEEEPTMPREPEPKVPAHFIPVSYDDPELGPLDGDYLPDDVTIGEPAEDEK